MKNELLFYKYYFEKIKQICILVINNVTYIKNHWLTCTADIKSILEQNRLILERSLVLPNQSCIISNENINGPDDRITYNI